MRYGRASALVLNSKTCYIPKRGLSSVVSYS
jgi:hypothetical protein